MRPFGPTRAMAPPVFVMLLNDVPFVAVPFMSTGWETVQTPCWVERGSQPGSPSRKSEKLLKVSDPMETPGNIQFHRSRSTSPPNRNVCFPCVQESWSATCHWVMFTFESKAPPLGPAANNPVTVRRSRLGTLGDAEVIPTCVFVNGVVIEAFMMLR